MDELNTHKKTIPMSKCIFPFKYKKKKYSRCIRSKYGLVCASKVNKNLNVDTWKKCVIPKSKQYVSPEENDEIKLNQQISKSILKSSKKKLDRTKSNRNKANRNKENRNRKLTKKQVSSNKVKVGSREINVSNKSIIKLIVEQSKSFKCQSISRSNKFLGAGVANTVIEGCLDLECKNKVAVRIMTISTNYKRVSNHPVTIEKEIYKISNKLVESEKNPHALYCLKNLTCHYNSILENDPKLLKSIMEKDNIKRELNIMLLELCPYGTIGDYIMEHTKKNHLIKPLIFQTILSLIICQYYIPGFKHNDLHSSNIILGNYNFEGEDKYLNEKKSLSVRNNNKYFIKYEILGKNFYVPYTGKCAKIFDYDVSCSQKLKNDKLISDLYMENGVTHEKNPVFDLHLFLNSSFSPIQNKLDDETCEFFERNIPEDYRGRDGDFLGFSRLTNYSQTRSLKDTNLVPPNILTPTEIIYDDYFKEYTMEPKGKVIYTYKTGVPEYDKLKVGRRDLF